MHGIFVDALNEVMVAISFYRALVGPVQLPKGSCVNSTIFPTIFQKSAPMTLCIIVQSSADYCQLHSLRDIIIRSKILAPNAVPYCNISYFFYFDIMKINKFNIDVRFVGIPVR